MIPISDTKYYGHVMLMKSVQAGLPEYTRTVLCQWGRSMLAEAIVDMPSKADRAVYFMFCKTSYNSVRA